MPMPAHASTAMRDLFHPPVVGWCLTVAAWCAWDRLDAGLDHAHRHAGACFPCSLGETATITTGLIVRRTLAALARERGLA